MRKHDVRKWLHAILDLLPVIIIPVFMIYSHRHTIDNYEVQYAQNEIVDFNQYVHNGDFSKGSDSWATYNVINVSFNDNFSATFDVLGNNTGVLYQGYSDRVLDDKYLVSFDILVSDYTKMAGCRVRYPFVHNFSLSSNFAHIEIIDVCTETNIGVQLGANEEYTATIDNFQCFNLTQMFGSGNEPTIEEFNTYFTNDYYDYTISKKTLVKNVGSITYDDTDIGSQMLYCLYNSVDKYFNLNNVFGFNNVYDWLSLNIFNGNPPIAIYIVWNIALYEFLMDLIMLLYALFMWFIDMCEHLIDRSFGVASGRKK